MARGENEAALAMLEPIVKESPTFIEAHVSLATVYYRLKRKDEGDREKATVAELTSAGSRGSRVQGCRIP